MAANSFGRRKHCGDHIRRVGIVFGGGPAPAANAVISAAAVSFLDDDRQVVGFMQGYQYLQDYDRAKAPLVRDEHYRELAANDVTGARNSQRILIGTSRANPAKGIATLADLDDSAKTARLRNVYLALLDLGVDALISIGGDDTLKTANFLYEYQRRLPSGARRIQVVHVPKTIDNDYQGIDFTFGYFTAVDFLAKEMKNLRADAEAGRVYYIAECMGRKAGWLSYGVGIAGEANMIVSVEDIDETMTFEDEVADPATGEIRKERRLSVDVLVGQIVNLMLTRERRERKYFGTVVVAEGLAETFPERYIRGIQKDEHGNLVMSKIDIGREIARLVAAEYKRRTGKEKKVIGLQLGYECRCAPPHAFDVMLGSQLGIGAYRALVEEDLDGHMVSATGQLDLTYVPFKDLINPDTLKAEVRFIRPGSDFHLLARFLESRTEVVDE